VELIVILLIAAVLAWALTGLALRLLSGPPHLAHANNRSMHVRPTPTGGGIAIVATVLVLMLVLWAPLSSTHSIVLVAMAALGLVSALDQYRPVWPVTRLLAQALAVAVCFSLVPETVRLVPSIDLWVERLGVGLLWLWLINLTNFMDGIDGIAGAQGIAVALGYGLCLLWPLPTTVAMTPGLGLALILAGACFGYLVWNWHPARIFMGDAGSIPLGFLLGWLLLDLAVRGHGVAALILPLSFVADATLTLARRLLSGAKPWHPHRMHLYQRAVSGGASPPKVVAAFAVANFALIGLAVQSITRPGAALIPDAWRVPHRFCQSRAATPNARCPGLKFSGLSGVSIAVGVVGAASVRRPRPYCWT
jgi:UDP-N-acetylmuramyl pentapeptide phosphotransferase/UDP-N-acetylglucosamine-1-phosphate transferase